MQKHGVVTEVLWDYAIGLEQPLYIIHSIVHDFGNRGFYDRADQMPGFEFIYWVDPVVGYTSLHIKERYDKCFRFAKGNSNGPYLIMLCFHINSKDRGFQRALDQEVELIEGLVQVESEVTGIGGDKVARKEGSSFAKVSHNG